MIVPAGREGDYVDVDRELASLLHLTRRRSSVRTDAAASKRSALSSVSAHSASAFEPQVMPAPVPNRNWPPSSQKVLMPTASDARVRSASTQPIAPQ